MKTFFKIIFLLTLLPKLGLTQNNPIVKITEDTIGVIQLTIDSFDVLTTENMNFKIDTGWSKVHYYIGGSYFFNYTHYKSEKDGIKLIYETDYIKDFHPDSTTMLKKNLHKIIIYKSSDFCLTNDFCINDLNYKKVKNNYEKPKYKARNYSLGYDGIQFYFKKGNLDYIEINAKENWPKIPEIVMGEFEFNKR